MSDLNAWSWLASLISFPFTEIISSPFKSLPLSSALPPATYKQKEKFLQITSKIV